MMRVISSPSNSTTGLATLIVLKIGFKKVSQIYKYNTAEQTFVAKK